MQSSWNSNKSKCDKNSPQLPFHPFTGGPRPAEQPQCLFFLQEQKKIVSLHLLAIRITGHHSPLQCSRVNSLHTIRRFKLKLWSNCQEKDSHIFTFAILSSFLLFLSVLSGHTNRLNLTWIIRSQIR